MQVKVTADPAELARVAADRIAALVRQKPDAVILAATGNTPMATYARLASMRAAATLDTSRLRIVQLDEYLGLTAGDPRSLYGWMSRALLQPLAIDASRVIRLDGTTVNSATTCQAFDSAVAAAGGIDLAVLGLGLNGHLGFNEPPSPPDAPTRPVTLTDASLASNAAYWGDRARVPRTALTAGMPTILKSRQILLLVSGASKRDILRRVTAEPATPEVPASLLQTCPHAVILADRAAV
jgi:glucosamine-6-phosphate deaminase